MPLLDQYIQEECYDDYEDWHAYQLELQQQLEEDEIERVNVELRELAVESLEVSEDSPF